MPKVSILLPTYNRPEWLRGSVDSIISQSFTDWELLALDNGGGVCPDLPYDPRISLSWFQTNNERCPWSYLESQASGDYLVMFSDDDLMQPDNLAQKVDILDANPSVGFVWSPVEEMDSAGNAVGPQLNGYMGDEPILTQAATFDDLVLQSRIPMVSTMFRRRLFEHWAAAVPFGVYADWALWLELSRVMDQAYIPDRLVRLRLHEGSDSARNGVKNGLFLHEMARVWQRWLNDGWVPSREQRTQMGKLYLHTAYTRFQAMIP